MAKISRYFLSGSNNFTEFALNYANISLQDSSIFLTGTENIDSVYLGKGFSFDFTQSGNGLDAIYLSGASSDYQFYKTDSDAQNDYQTLVLWIAASGNTPKTEIKVHANDKLIFSNGSINVANVIAAVTATTEDATASVGSLTLTASETANQFHTLADNANSNSQLHSYAQDSNADGIVFGQHHNGTLLIRGGAGVDVVYVTRDSKVVATELADGVDKIYLTQDHSAYTPTVTGNVLKLVAGNESVTVLRGDQLIFTNGAVSVADAISAAINNGWQNLALDNTILTPISNDTVAPSAPQLSIASGQDQYLNASETSVTIKATFTAAGDTELMLGDRLQLRQGTTALENHIVTAGDITAGFYNFTVDKTAIASDASYSFTVLAIDANGNTSTNNSHISITVDNTAPTVSAISLSASGVMNDYLNADDVVTATVTFAESVTASAGATLSIDIGNSARIATLRASDTASGNIKHFVYTIAPTDNSATAISIAQNTALTGTFTDLAGNSSTALTLNASTTLTSVMVDTSSPSAPGISFNDTGSNTSDGVTGDGNLTLTGLEQNATWQYRIGNQGDWMTGTGNHFNAQAGINSYQVRQIDLAGNTSDASNPLTIDYRIKALGFVINGQGVSNWSGFSVSAAGDVNGDGLVDLIVGANGANGNAGRSYVVFGKTANTEVNLSALGTSGFVINGASANEFTGYSVSAAGDVNGDDLADLIVGAYGANSNAGLSYVVFGKTANTAVDLSALGTGGFIINGASANDRSAYSVSAAGDVNGDGLVDLIVGAYQSDPVSGSNAGRSYVVFGKTADTTAVNLSNIANGTGGFVINGQGASDQSGISVSAAGDVNGDGLADLIVGANLSDPLGRGNAGRSYVIFGKTDTSAINLADVATTSANGYLSPINNPSTGADIVTGTSANELLVGGAGNDMLTGNGGSDVMLGGAGNDVLVLNSSNITGLSSSPALAMDSAGVSYSQLARVDGGSGIDTLRVAGGANLNLSNSSQIAASNPEICSRISSIERIDLANDSAANTLTLGLADVLDMTGLNLFNTGSGWSNVTGTALSASVAKHQLAITGGATDTVDIDMSAWTKVTGSVSDGSVNYDVWNHNTAAAQLLIQQNVMVI